MGRQAIGVLPGGTIHSVFDSEGRRIAEYDEASGDLIQEYVWMGWDPVAVIEGGVVYYVRADHIGRPAFATDVSGAVIWSASYLPFGEVRVSTGTVPTMRFPGQWFQSESGLHQNWMRDYDPTTGRYLQADPLGLVDGASVYGYALQNPGRWVDPRGEEKVPFTLPSDPSGLGPKWVPFPQHVMQPTFKLICSEEKLRFDSADAGGNPYPHWHYYPNGRLRKRDQFYHTLPNGEPGDGFHIRPGSTIYIENCSCNTGSAGGVGAPAFIAPGVLFDLGKRRRDISPSIIYRLE